MSTSRTISMSLVAIFIVAAFSFSVAYADEPEELEERLKILNDRLFEVKVSSLSDEQKIYYDEAKRYLADVQLNMNYGNYVVVEELLVSAEEALAKMEAAEKSSSFFMSPFFIFPIVILLIVGIVFVLTSPRKPSDAELSTPQMIPQSNPVAQSAGYSQVASTTADAERCQKCNGRMYQGHCVWCEFPQKN
jgi:hypothetical protein